MELQVGDKVKLYAAPSLLSTDSLNTYFLQEQGIVWDSFVPVTEVCPNGRYVVQLPSGYKLGIYAGDILGVEKR
jgi:hypothetical protein